MPVRFWKTPLLLAIATLFVSAAVWGQAPKQNWKDRAEYDLYEAAVKATDNNKKLELLNTWRQKYPTTDFRSVRLEMFLVTYDALNQPARVLETGSEILSLDPKNLRALVLITTNGQKLLANATPQQQSLIEKCARTLTTDLDALKPPEVPQENWDKSKPQILALAYTVLGGIDMQRKDYQAAEKDYTQSLKVNPNNGQVSYQLGTAMLFQKNPDKQAVALYHIARAAAYTGPGAYPEAGRKEVQAYLTKAYTTYHGSTDGLDALEKTAASQPFPPDGFKILTGAEVQAQKEEAFRKANPMLALWQSIKGQLTGANGAQYFDSSMKGALLPGGVEGVSKFKGKLIAAKPPKGPKQLVLSIENGTTPDATLNLEEPLPGTAPIGTELEFEGVPTSFMADPFMITFDVQPDALVGWPTPPPAGAKKGAPPRRAPKK